MMSRHCHRLARRIRPGARPPCHRGLGGGIWPARSPVVGLGLVQSRCAVCPNPFTLSTFGGHVLELAGDDRAAGLAC